MRAWPFAFALTAGPALAAMTLTSTDLTPGAPMPAAHVYPRCGGRNISPQLAWSGAPAATRSLVLTMIDMDVEPALWSHWIVVDLPPATPGLARGIAALPAPAKGVVSNFGDPTYDGPCPPPGSGIHHYQFTIWALPSAQVSLKPDEKAPEVIAQLQRVALDRASLTVSVAAKP